MEDRLPRKLAAILYVDVAGSSRLTGEDEDATHRTLSKYLDLSDAGKKYQLATCEVRSADVVGSTALVQLNETLAHQRIQDAFRRFSEIISSHDGVAHEIRGDALVAEFAGASDAVAASVDFQEANTTRASEKTNHWKHRVVQRS